MSSQNSFSGLKPNKKECEVAGTCVKKGVKVALCGMKNINLKKNSENSQSSLFLQQKIENEKNFKNHIQIIEDVLKIWRMRNLTLEEKITT